MSVWPRRLSFALLAAAACSESPSTPDSGAPDSGAPDSGAQVDAGSRDAAAHDADAEDGGALDGGTGETWNVWRILPPALDTPRVQAIARQFGLEQPVIEDAEAFRVSAPRLGPAGAVTIAATGGWAQMGPSQDPVTGELEPSAFSLTGAIDRLGNLTLGGAASIEIAGTSAAGAQLTGTVTLDGAVAGTISLDDQRIVLVVPLRLTASCQGPGCGSGSCSTSFTVAFIGQPPQGGYRLTDGAARLIGLGSAPAFATCTGDADQAALGEAFDVPGHFASGLSVQLTPVVRDTGRSLTVRKSSGAIIYADPEARLPAAATLPLPTSTRAAALADDLLDRLGLRPPLAGRTVTRVPADTSEDATEQLVEVRVHPMLEAGTRGGRPVLVPVEDAHLEIDLGPEGRILGFRSSWRPAVLHAEVAARPEAPALASLLARLPEPVSAGPEARLAPMYFAAPEDEPQAYYDAVYTLRDGVGLTYGSTLATDFTPRLTALEPPLDAPLDGSAPIRLRARAGGGQPPYRYQWSLAESGPLGEGEELLAHLPDGRWHLGLAISDARGAGFRRWFPLQVHGSTAPQPGQQHPRAISGAIVVESPNGTRATLGNVPGGLGVEVGPVERGSRTFLEAVYLEQWRYNLTIEIDGARYTLRSDKCVPGALASGGACHGPPPPFVIPSASDTTISSRGDGTTVSRTLIFENLPGTFTLDYRYHSGGIANVACDPGVLGHLGTFVATGSTLVERSSGGRCPGFVPQIDWTYQPPDGGRLAAEDLLTFCELAAGEAFDGYVMCGVPPELLGRIDPGASFPIVEFSALLYTLVAPHIDGLRAATSLVQDTGAPTLLANTDGAIDRARQPLLAALGGTDLFVEIEPMARETTVIAAWPNRPGLYDNFHSKGAYFQTRTRVNYPGCNAATAATDTAPCVHLHERWLEGQPFSRGQLVSWAVVRDRPRERRPRFMPTSLDNTEPLFANGSYADVVLWHISSASSSECHPAAGDAGGPGGVDNADRPCQVFTSPIFLTH